MEIVVDLPARREFPRVAPEPGGCSVPPGCSLPWAGGLRSLFCLLFLLSACKPSFSPVDLKPDDVCARCRNPIRNPLFAGEITFIGGETMKFDDLGCLVAFHYGIDSATACGVFVQDYNKGGWIGEEEAVVLLHSSIVTPRYSNSIAFTSDAEARKARAAEGGTVLALTEVLKKETTWMEQSPK